MKGLKVGTKVELEHKPTFKWIRNYVKKTGKVPPDKMIAMNIAKNHIAEKRNYYKVLKKVNL